MGVPDAVAEGKEWAVRWFRYRNTCVGLEWREFECNRACSLDAAYRCVEFRIFSAMRGASSEPNG